jgi:hypothetical protein
MMQVTILWARCWLFGEGLLSTPCFINLKTLDLYLTGKLNAEQLGNLEESSSLDAIKIGRASCRERV